MAENTSNTERQFAIQKIYTKDISFETPNSPQIFTQKWEPAVELNLDTKAVPLEDSVFEVALTVTVTVKLGDSVAYLLETCQAGIFVIDGFVEQEMGAMLGSFCPNILFPYAREVVSDLVSKGGFPQLALAPVNFDALYMQHLQQLQQQATSSDTPTLN